MRKEAFGLTFTKADAGLILYLTLILIFTTFTADGLYCLLPAALTLTFNTYTPFLSFLFTAIFPFFGLIVTAPTTFVSLRSGGFLFKAGYGQIPQAIPGRPPVLFARIRAYSFTFVRIRPAVFYCYAVRIFAPVSCRIRIPSCLRLMAAFTSRSSRYPHGHW